MFLLVLVHLDVKDNSLVIMQDLFNRVLVCVRFRCSRLNITQMKGLTGKALNHMQIMYFCDCE